MKKLSLQVHLTVLLQGSLKGENASLVRRLLDNKRECVIDCDGADLRGTIQIKREANRTTGPKPRSKR